MRTAIRIKPKWQWAVCNVPCSEENYPLSIKIVKLTLAKENNVLPRELRRAQRVFRKWALAPPHGLPPQKHGKQGCGSSRQSCHRNLEGNCRDQAIRNSPALEAQARSKLLRSQTMLLDILGSQCNRWCDRVLRDRSFIRVRISGTPAIFVKANLSRRSWFTRS